MTNLPVVIYISFLRDFSGISQSLITTLQNPHVETISV
jgi:hypothetical protein